jgi:hypothetical protein
MSDLSSSPSRWPQGARVQVYNPGPLDVGRVARRTPDNATRVPVDWDDGSSGLPHAHLLRVIEEASSDGNR